LIRSRVSTGDREPQLAADSALERKPRPPKEQSEDSLAGCDNLVELKATLSRLGQKVGLECTFA
jgi:hypothetical protein